jgi:hypothetical protein
MFNKFLCKIFGHKWVEYPPSLVSINECKRCGYWSRLIFKPIKIGTWEGYEAIISFANTEGDKKELTWES